MRPAPPSPLCGVTPMHDRPTHKDSTAVCALLGRQIRGIREGRGLSDRDLATQAGVMTSTVAVVEQGLDSVPIGTIARVAGALGCTLAVTPAGATLTPLGDRLARGEAA